MKTEKEKFNEWFEKAAYINEWDAWVVWLACAELKQVEIEKLKAENAKMREALAVYGDVENWDIQEGESFYLSGVKTAFMRNEQHGYELAQKTLKEIDANNGNKGE